MAETGNWPAEKPVCHSANPVGKERIEGVIARYYAAPDGKRVRFDILPPKWRTVTGSQIDSNVANASLSLSDSLAFLASAHPLGSEGWNHLAKVRAAILLLPNTRERANQLEAWRANEEQRIGQLFTIDRQDAEIAHLKGEFAEAKVIEKQIRASHREQIERINEEMVRRGRDAEQDLANAHTKLSVAAEVEQEVRGVAKAAEEELTVLAVRRLRADLDRLTSLIVEAADRLRGTVGQPGFQQTDADTLRLVYAIEKACYEVEHPPKKERRGWVKSTAGRGERCSICKEIMNTFTLPLVDTVWRLRDGEEEPKPGIYIGDFEFGEYAHKSCSEIDLAAEVERLRVELADANASSDSMQERAIRAEAKANRQ